MIKLAGRVAMIVGGASGLGEATALRLAKAGCKVVVADLQEDLGTKVVKTIGNDNAFFVNTDVANESSVKTAFGKAAGKFGTVHMLINTAGIFHSGTVLSEQCTAEEFMKILSVNVIGTFNTTKAAAALMVKNEPVGNTKERGVIINVSSTLAMEGLDFHLFYSGTKAAIMGMTLPLARDLGQHGIRVMTIAPGMFDTPLLAKFVPNPFRRMIEKTMPADRTGNPEEFAEICHSICVNTYLTGSIIRIDGGLRVCPISQN